MNDAGLHAERTELAWVRTWLAAVVGVALTLRLLAGHREWLFAAIALSVSLAAAAAAAAATSRTGCAARQALALVSIVVAAGSLTLASVVIEVTRW